MTAVPEWDATHGPTSTADEVAAFYGSDTSAVFYLLGRAISNMLGDVGLVNHAKAQLFLGAARIVAEDIEGFDISEYSSYQALAARYP